MKTKSYHFTRLLSLLAILTLVLVSSPAASNAEMPTFIEPEAPLPTAFTYQGYLSQNGIPVSGSCDFVFSLWSVVSGISPMIGTPITKTNVPVASGVFTQLLDFGDAPFFTGEARWLQVEVRCPSGGGSYTTLSPRQLLTATPFATYARGVWDFGAKGSIEAGIPRDYGPGWIFYAANGHRREIMAADDGIRIAAGPNDGPSDDRQFAITENGNVGIGTKTPAERLHVVGNRVRMQNGDKILDLRTDGTQVDIESTTNSIVVSSSGSGHHVVMNPSQNTGNVGIGTFSPNDGKLQITTENGDAIRVVKAGDDGIQIGDGANFPKYGLYVPGPGTPDIALNVRTAQSAGEWAVFTEDKIRAANVTMNSVTVVAVVDGAFELNAGDVVAAVGFAEQGMEDPKPLVKVALATSGSAGIVGVVEGRMALLPEPSKADEDPPLLVLHSAPGPAKAGDYVAITIAGVAQVKVDASTTPIATGQRLTSAQMPGRARGLRSADLDGMVVTEGAPVIGVALESFDAGQGLVWTLVSLH